MSWEDNQLNNYFNELDNDQSREEAIEYKTVEIKEQLLAVRHKYELAFVLDANGFRCEMSDFIADMQINDIAFAEFMIGGGSFTGNNSMLRNELDKQLDTYCEGIATELIAKLEREG